MTVRRSFGALQLVTRRGELDRREVLSARNELLRTNPYWRAYEGSRLMVEWIRRRKQPAEGRELSSTSHTSAGFFQSLRLAAARMQ